MAKRTRPAVCEWCGDDYMARDDREPRYCSRKCCGLAKRGVPLVAHPLFNGGLAFDKASGRWKIMCRDGSQMWFYRGVVAARIGRLLRPDELVHHDNEDSADDRDENLIVTTRHEHPTLHAAA
jgi:hypothetical protein